jgi:UrcA family protein
MRKYALIAAAASLAGLAAVPAAHAQDPGPYVDELVVEGYVGPDGPNRLSQTVAYGDLDLTTMEGREMLRLRIRDTAGDLCRAMREDPDARSPLLASCRDDAIRSARNQVRAAVDRAYANASYAYLDPEARGDY